MSLIDRIDPPLDQVPCRPADESRGEAIEQALIMQDWRRAEDLLGQQFQARPTLANAHLVLDRLGRIPDRKARATCRLMICRSFTVEPIVPLLRAGAALQGLSLTAAVGAFNAYVQELLDPASALYNFRPDAVILAVQSRDLVPDLWGRFLAVADVAGAIDQVLADMDARVAVFRAHSPAHLVLPTLEQPCWPQAGFLDGRSELGQVEAFGEINRGIRQLARRYPGVSVFDYDALVARHGRLTWHDERKWLAMRMPLAADSLAHLAAAYLRILVPLAGLTAKVLVVDLDETLWGGVVAEDGLAGIRLGADHPGAAHIALQQALLDLHHRGVLLAIASKNNEADALEALEHHPDMLLRPHHFSAWRINWNDKAQSLREIAAELNLGLDSLAFLDDNPAERALIRQALPDVHVLELPHDPLGYAAAVRSDAAFERLAVTEEDVARSRYYSDARHRTADAAAATTLDGFLRSLAMRAEIAAMTAVTLPRVAQLTQKTNQFNLTTRRYSDTELAGLTADPHWQAYTLRLQDSFGDNGLVGAALLRFTGDICEVDTFLLSCRVIGRTAETALLAYVAGVATAAGTRWLQGWFCPTLKNAPAREFYRSHGFQPVETRVSDTLWRFDLSNGTIRFPEWITCPGKERDS
ncbi:MAG: HAD-IIIC family phosphatase [Candidatus Sericytochromatia bacterium]|nr:HAD-IIIC family phosphatase [Candidatus Sericytochromatia bacterium]